MQDQDFKAIRKEYLKGTLDTKSINPNPIDQFKIWFNDAVDAQLIEVNAMHLATASTEGIPSSRIVLLKEIKEGKFIFYTSYQSRKGKELEKNPACSLNFFWRELERQVRIRGIADRVSPEQSDTYFHSRPRESQIGAWVSPQSTIIKSRQILEERREIIEKRYKKQAVLPRPKQWGGYQVMPYEIEFWQGRSGRLHDRIVYHMQEDQWVLNRLAP